MWFVATARRRKENGEKRYSDRRSARQKICTYIRSGFSWPALRKGGEEAWKEFFTGNISLLGKGVEKWRGSSARGWSGSAKIIGFLKGCRHHCIFPWKWRPRVFFFFFFSFFGYRETCNFGTQLETSGLNFYIFGLSIETFLFRFAKFLTRSRASTVSIRERKMRKSVSWYDALGAFVQFF